MDNPKEGRGGFARALGRRDNGPEGASAATAEKSGAGVGIVVANSVSDRSDNGRSAGARTEQADKEHQSGDSSAKSGWTAVRTKSAVRPQKTAGPADAGEAKKVEGDEAPIPRSRLGRARNTEPSRAPRVRRARLKVVNIDPWSVMKVSFLFSVAVGLVFLVAVALLWTALDVMGFFATVGGTVSDVSGGQHSSGFDVVAFFSLPRVMGMATILALINTIVITALATLASYLYNLSTELVGGVEMTLAEEE